MTEAALPVAQSNEPSAMEGFFVSAQQKFGDSTQTNLGANARAAPATT